MTATLQILNGKTAGTKHILTHPITRIGRHPECEIQIDISAASRFHAHVVQDNDRNLAGSAGDFFSIKLSTATDGPGNSTLRRCSTPGPAT